MCVLLLSSLLCVHILVCVAGEQHNIQSKDVWHKGSDGKDAVFKISVCIGKCQQSIILVFTQ